MATRRSLNLQSRNILFTQVATFVGILGILLLARAIPLSESDWISLVGLSIVYALVFAAMVVMVVPRFGMRPWVMALGAFFAIALVIAYAYLLRPYGIRVEVLLLVIVAGIGLAAGKKAALVAAPLPALAEIVLVMLLNEHARLNPATMTLQILILLMAGFGISLFAGLIHDQLIRIDRRNRYLSTLFQASSIASRSTDLLSTLSYIAELITRDTPATTCSIYLLDPTGNALVTYGAYPIRPLDNWDVQIGDQIALEALPAAKKALEESKHQICYKNVGDDAQDDPNAELFVDGVRTVCLIPLTTKGKRLGIVSVGEARSMAREPFSQEKIDLLLTLASQISATIHNSQLYHDTQRNAQRLAVLNEVAKAVGSTIELDALLELIYQQVSQVIKSDTYYVSLYNALENTLDIRILLDDGERFPPQIVPIGDGFSSWVLKTRQPLLVRHLTEERDNLPFKPIQMGQAKLSESWLGIPLLVGTQILGLLAIASYAPHAFDDEDVSLLNNLAAQAALALDNARQHAAVKEQARRDSLTGVYNHGYLISRLEEEVEKSRNDGSPVSLIMLDIDHFKKYNDNYGHQVGDETLCTLCKAILAHIKKTDIVGRWGGEEFAIALPSADTGEAMEVAQRIRKTLADLELRDRHNQPIPSPTISQGIATFPQHAKDAAELVDVADMALYKAKGMGRDQVMAAEQAISSNSTV